MRVRVDIDVDRCCNRFSAIYDKAQKFLDNEVLKDSSPYVPMDTGALMNSGTSGTVLGSGEVVWNAPYSSRMYYGDGFNFQKTKHPKACARWFEIAKAANLASWVKGVNSYFSGR